MKFLITAFEPFGNDSKNPTMDVIKGLELPDVDTLVLPVTFNFFQDFTEAIEDKKYDYILHLGQGGGRNKITFEKVALNYMDARIADNNGDKPVNQPIVADGPDGLFTTLPIREIVIALQQKGYPASISYTAGTYVCNYIMYSSLHYFRDKSTKVGFVHIPYSPEQIVDKELPSMSIDLVKEIIKETIKILSLGSFQSEQVSLGETH
ncbi:pyroglutamyl-peptidase I [Alkalicella caledoniensis]|uniref:Pyroglutamyl-peptidase I n=1 Tax=Alkalicella caledoniensis TaxID=2731377 RepID=A0A7G9WAJ7_ALKCA|nr:pyroglutamyl-peptidase I [Alkalicella caledoniensis]QNO15709.1 pyroglutamyl-peptidase I [Alkalicella caledoniensis]